MAGNAHDGGKRSCWRETLMMAGNAHDGGKSGIRSSSIIPTRDRGGNRGKGCGAKWASCGLGGVNWWG